MHVELFELFGAAFVLTTCLMFLFWVIGIFKNNAGIVDIGWALCFFLVIIAFLLIGDGYWMKRVLLAAMVSVWSLRLAWHLWRRFDFTVEDPRYTSLKAKFGEEMMATKMLLMFFFQGFLVIILSIPFVIVAGYSESGWSFSEAAGILCWALGIAGEYFADKELETFKADPGNSGKVCDQGLWRYSRHPNYFFEWVIWIGYFLFALPSPFGWFAIISPALMLLLLTRVSGIPLLEEQALKTKGDAYRIYQAKTSAFIPLPPKH